MSIAEENVSFIKWDQETTELAELLKGYTKANLLELAGNQLVPVRKSWNKAKIADVLAGYTIEQAETIFHPVLKEALLSLPDLETNVYRVKNMEEIHVLVPFIRQGFFFAASEKDSILLTHS
ncbi:MAG: hypothetical protein U5K84_06985 [Alkalibacterium sp.]|nr:hypothetical protein [Alkalibacterium sp.]